MSNEKSATAPKALGFFTYVQTPDPYLAGSSQNFPVNRLPLIPGKDHHEIIAAFHRGDVKALPAYENESHRFTKG